MALISKSGRTIRLSRHIKDSLNITFNESGGTVIPFIGIVTYSIRGKK